MPGLCRTITDKPSTPPLTPESDACGYSAQAPHPYSFLHNEARTPKESVDCRRFADRSRTTRGAHFGTADGGGDRGCRECRGGREKDPPIAAPYCGARHRHAGRKWNPRAGSNSEAATTSGAHHHVN